MPPTDSSAFALLKQLSDQYLDRELERDEVIELRRAVSQHLVPLMDHPRKILLLGSFNDDDEIHLEEIEKLLDALYRVEGTSRAHVYKMNDVPGQDMWINLDFKFRLLADIADCIVGVVEHDKGGFTFEQGILATNPDYRDKTRLLKREYDSTEEEHNHYSAMQSEGLFDELDAREQLFRWSDRAELIEGTEDIFQELESAEQS